MASASSCKFMCDKCYYKAHSNDQLLVHKNFYHGDKVVPCRHCEKLFPNESEHSNHIKVCRMRKMEEDEEQLCKTFPLNRTRFINVKKWKDHPIVDIRQWYAAEGKYKPTRNGISLHEDEFNQLTLQSADIQFEKENGGK